MTVGVGTGALIADRYRLGERLGQGGMGQVYRASDLVLDRDVAVKVLDSGVCADAEARDACADEARVVARLSHPGIVGVFDSGVDRGIAFVVMELVSGEPLDQHVRDGRRPVPLDAAALAARVADALDYAHRQGVVHCDVKPQNIILTPDGQPKLVDFGIARVMTTSRSLAPDELRGSAPYVSPEQVRGERVDGRADVYALGAVLYELLTGRPPFQGATLVAILGQHLAGTAPLPRSLNPNVSPDLERVVLTALARDPSKRYATAGAFRDALREVVRGDRASALARTERVEQLRPRVVGRRGRPRRRFFPAFRPPIGKPAFVATAVAVLLVGTVLLLALARPSATTSSATPQVTDTAPTPPSSPTPNAAAPPTPTTQPGASNAPSAPPAAAPPAKPNGPSKPDGQGEQAREEQKKAEEQAREDQKKQEERAREEQKKAEERARDKRGRGN